MSAQRRQIVILGGGTGGTMTANRLRRRFDEDEAAIHVVDRDDRHVYQPGLLFVPFGLADIDEIVRPRRRQLRRGIEFHESEVESVSLDRETVLLADGTVLPYDALVVATGARLQPEETDGLTGPGWNERVFTFYTPEGAEALARALERFDRGRLVVNLVDMPIKCPVAPLELAFLADWTCASSGAKQRRDRLLDAPRRRLHQAGRLEASRRPAGREGDRTGHGVQRGGVDGVGGKLVSFDGRELDFDLLVTIPAHGGAAYVERSPELGDALGFVPPTGRPCRRTAPTSCPRRRTDLPTSKAGSVPHFEGEVITENVARYLTREPLVAGYDGHANCFIETGFEKALLIDFNYDTEPLPGRSPTAAGPPPLLRESRLNHMAKLLFQWIYWHALLPGRDLPGLGPAMPAAGKRYEPAPRVKEGRP